MRKLRVVVISSESPSHIWGGRGEHIKRLYPHLKGKVDLHLVCWDKRVSDVWYTHSHPYDSSPSWYIPNDGGFKNGALNETALLQHLLCLHQQQPIDVIHAHEWDAVIPAFNFRHITKVPVVTTFHLFQCQVRTIEEGHGNDDELYPCVAENWGLSASDEVIVVSHDMARFAKEKLCESRPLNVIHNGIDMHVFPIVDKPKREKPVALFCGRISKQKGIEAFLDAAEMCDAFSWIVMGQLTAIDPRDAARHPYAIRLRALQEQGKLIWIGHIEGDDRFSHFASADYIVMPSLIEPFGIVALEALAAGVPLVTTRVDGMTEFLDDANSHLCGPTGADIVAKLRELERNPFVRDSVIHPGFLTAKDFTWKGAAEKTLAILEKAYAKQDCVRPAPCSHAQATGRNIYYPHPY